MEEYYEVIHSIALRDDGSPYKLQWELRGGKECIDFFEEADIAKDFAWMLNKARKERLNALRDVSI